MRYVTLAALCVAATIGCKKSPETAMVDVVPPTASACGEQADGSRRFRVLHLNDVYRIEGLADGRGGLARVRSLRAQLEQDCEGAVLLTHAGDALFPSLLSREMLGAQMITVLNALDGDPTSHDPLMVATFGNHEFDKSKAKYAPMLLERVTDSQFTWLDTNIAWDPEAGFEADNLVASRLLDVGGVKVGVFGLTIDSKVPAYVSHIDTEYASVARTQTTDLRERGAEVVIAVTHLDVDDDEALMSTLGDAGPDIVLGGHDHVLQSRSVGGRPLLKGDADAVRVRTLDIRIAGDGGLTWTADEAGIALGPETMPADPTVDAIVKEQLSTFEASFCGEDVGCLSRPLTTTRVDLIAEETRIRRFETNLGDYITAQMQASFPDADVVFVNSGALRLNQDIAAGTPISRQIVEEIFAYPTPMHHLRIDASTLDEVLRRSTSGWTGQGHWLQVGGVSFRFDPDAGSISDVSLVKDDGRLVALEDHDGPLDVVTVNYLIDPSMGDQDGYTMLSLDQQVDDPANGTDLKQVVLRALTQAGEAGIAPEQRGFICNRQQPDAPCLLDHDE